ncbi:hypothetical protein A6770_34650 [Nostoc minutum NIES-26]|uniref:NB-ARC domain-containing protein n=1 Tax=Nostoc minutum NIES-26 TaxID=1844469 RepID=A0A367S325_9NOSO|nr:hypothetical protein A6770_34650 [Nostoc minutum NIES-26]
MTAKLDRRDVGFTIISRFEEAFRQFLSEALSILFDNYQDGIPNGVIEKAKARAKKDNWDNCDDFFEDTDFPDLKEISYYGGMYQDYFPHSNFSLQQFQEYMDELYKLRCKIAHIRGAFTSLDLDKLSELTKIIAVILERFGQEFLEFIKILEENPEQVTIPAPIEFTNGNSNLEFSGIIHNLPTPDYEFEGGFVGRKEDIQKVTKMFEGEQVVTIAGAGGVGKTALASKVVEEILRRNKYNFDCIVWLSAKETKLSYLGIEDIEPTVKNYEQLLDTILDVMGFPSDDNDSVAEKEHSVKIGSELFNSILLVVDNLETISDESIVNFLLDIRVNYPNIKVMITSRRGLGQVERRYELKQLKEKEAVVLFRLIAKDKSLDDLLKLDEEIIQVLVKKLSYYPLAIKWMLGQVAIGKSIYQIIDSIDETTSDISRFSFEQIYNSLTDYARKIICTLSCFDEPPPAGVLSYVVDIDKEELEDGIKELVLVSLVIPERFKNEQGELSTRYILLPLTRGYVRHQREHPNLAETKKIVKIIRE